MYRYTAHRFMIRTFGRRGLKRMYERDDPITVSADMANRIELDLADLGDAGAPSVFDLPGYRLHPLKDTRKGYWSIAISGHCRLIFLFEDGDAHDVDPVDYRC